ncbi:hypothetical protein HID58_030924 [Brassica napus]|uniref:Uncharacterized protein n=1 Tax=Brassica napus TaxID=3708 RepID=A0ABQ8CIV7_BRANA|nr:hypothetical protein HID58_030924 [Brassica napus]
MAQPNPSGSIQTDRGSQFEEKGKKGDLLKKSSPKCLLLRDSIVTLHCFERDLSRIRTFTGSRKKISSITSFGSDDGAITGFSFLLLLFLLFLFPSDEATTTRFSAASIFDNATLC